MRIVFVTNKRYPNPRGSSGRLEDLREKLTKRGHEVFVIASMRGKDIPVEGGVSRYWVVEFQGGRFVWCRWRVQKQLEAIAPDVVHTQQYDGLGRIAREWAIRKHIPWVQTVSDIVSIQKSRKVHDIPDVSIVPVGAIGRALERNGVPHQKITVIPTGVSEEKFSGGNGDLVREEWHIPEKARVLLSVSRLTQEKNTEFLFRSLLPFLRVSPDVYLLCVGGGNLLDGIRDSVIAEGLQERILFADEVPRTRMKHYYSAGDIFVYASKEDFRATVVAEAMYAGLPVVAVASGGARERVANNVTGFLVSEQADAFSGAVERLLKDPVKGKSFGHSARILIETSYTNEKTTDALIAVYDRVMRSEE